MSISDICDIYELRGISDTDYRVLMTLERQVGTGFISCKVDWLAAQLECSEDEAVDRVKSLCRRGILGPLRRRPMMHETIDGAAGPFDTIHGRFVIQPEGMLHVD